MFILYLDESGNTGTDYDNPTQKIFTLAGLALNDKDWYDLNYKIQKEKEKISPDLINYEIHTNDIFQSSRNIGKGYDFRKNTLEYNLDMLEKLVDLVVDLNLPIFSVVIDKQKFKKFITKVHGPSIKIDPYLYAFSFLSIEYNNFLIQNNSNGMILVDENNNIMDSLEKVYSKLIGDNFEGDTNNIIENVLFLESKKNNFIQLADLCNFYINKYYTINWFGSLNNANKNLHCLRMFKKLEPLIKNCKNFDLIDNINNFWI
ncbi:putative uncharacterized protein [Clostridium sp. CAG:470]|nr:putative uncharacterized protein [Clostridium sp. CAG:470]